MRRIRGAKIGAIFQDPLTSLNPIYSIGRQLIEAVQLHREGRLRIGKNRGVWPGMAPGLRAPAGG